MNLHCLGDLLVELATQSSPFLAQKYQTWIPLILKMQSSKQAMRIVMPFERGWRAKSTLTRRTKKGAEDTWVSPAAHAGPRAAGLKGQCCDGGEQGTACFSPRLQHCAEGAAQEDAKVLYSSRDFRITEFVFLF